MAVSTFSRIATTDRITNVTAATLAVTEADHEGQTITLNRAAGITVTLPASTGGGARYRFVVGTTVTSNSNIIRVANASDVMAGSALLLADGGDTIVGFAAGATVDTVSMDGTTMGGFKGAFVMLEDIALNLWHVHYISDASGTEATPFSATVS